MAQAHRKKKAREALERAAIVGMIVEQGQGARASALLALVLGMVVALTYAFTLYPGVPPGDAGELIVAAYHGGVVHPPGYPLYALLARAFTWLPFHSIAWRVNLLSAVCGAGTAAFLFLALVRWTSSRWAALVSAAGFAFSPLAWNFSVGAEVFALNNLFASVLLYLSVRYWQERKLALARVGAIVFGLAMSHHHTILFLGLPLAAWNGWIMPRSARNLRELAIQSGLFALGLLPYLWLMIAAGNASPVSWGETETFTGLIRHLLRQEYGTFSLSLQEARDTGLLLGLFHYAKQLLSETWGAGIALAGAGVFHALRTEGKKGPAAVWLVAWVFYTVAFHGLANKSYGDPVSHSVVSRFWLLPNLVVFAFAGLGVRAVPARWSLAVPAIAVALSMGQFLTRVESQNQSQNHAIEAVGRALLDSLPANAIVFLEGDTITNSVNYLRFCEGRRPDVAVIARPLLRANWYVRHLAETQPEVRLPGARYHHELSQGFNLKSIFDANLSARPVLMSEFDKAGSPEGDDRSWYVDFEVWPKGFLVQVRRKSEPFDIEAYIRESDAALSTFDPRVIPDRSVQTVWEQAALGEYRHAHRQRVTATVAYALQPGHERALLPAIRALEELRADHSAVGAEGVPELNRMLGVAYYQLVSKAGKSADPSWIEGMRDAFETYVSLAPADEPDVPKARAIMAQFPRE